MCLFVAMEIEKAVSIQKAGEGAAEEWLELPNGCLCCTIKTTALQAIESLLIRKAGQIDYILLETTGLADPYPIINSFWADEALECRAYLDGVVCLVDAKNIEGQLMEWKVLMQQFVLADVILINKTDLIGADELTTLKEKLNELNPLARMKECRYGNIGDLRTLLDLKSYGAVDCSFAQHQKGYLELMGMLSVTEGAGRGVKRDHKEVRSVKLSTAKTVDRNKFEKWLFGVLWSDDEQARFKVLRAKGLMRTNKKKDIVVQAVQELYEITELEMDSTMQVNESVLIFLGLFEDESAVETIKESFYSSIY